MVEITPTDGPGQFAMRLANIERRLSNVETARRTPFTEIYDEAGNLVAKFSAAGIEFYDTAGNVITRLDGAGTAVLDSSGNVVSELAAGGVTVYDASGNPLTEIDQTGLHVFDDTGTERLTAGVVGANHGVEVRAGDDTVQFQVTGEGMSQPYLTSPVTELGPANRRVVTSGTFLQVYSGQVEYTSHPGLYCWVFADTDAGTTGEIRLRAWYNGATQNTTAVVSIPSGGGVLQQFRWLHDIPLTTGPITIYVDGRRTGGAGDLRVFQSSGITMAPAGLCVADGVP